MTLLTFACAQPTYLTKPGLDQSTFDRDSHECERNTDTHLAETDDPSFIRCMGARGYTAVPRAGRSFFKRY